MDTKIEVTAITPAQNGRNYSGAKEMISSYSAIVLDHGEMIELVSVRCYMGRSKQSSNVYASLWLHGNVYASGRGTAGGGGYHKESAAIDDAIESAGIKLSHSIAGVGESAITEALEAIAMHLGYSQVLVVRN